MDISSGDCLDYHAFDYFRHSPSFGYDPDKGIDGAQCARLCSESNMPHAGLVMKRYCLCARDSEYPNIKSIAKVADELCTNSDYYVRYFPGVIKKKIHKLSIRPSKDTALTVEDVYFELSVANTNVEYSLDFGDGSDRTEWSVSSLIKHQYYISGLFTVTVYARLHDNPKEVAREITTIKIHSEIQNENVQVDCPGVLEPYDNVDCNITMFTGTDLQMKMDFGDGYFTNLTNLPGKLISHS